MRGGTFNYAYLHVDNFCVELEYLLTNSKYGDQEGSDGVYFLEKDTLEIMQFILEGVKKSAKLMKEVEWLYSGDTGDESFKERVKEILKDE